MTQHGAEAGNRTGAGNGKAGGRRNMGRRWSRGRQGAKEHGDEAGKGTEWKSRAPEEHGALGGERWTNRGGVAEERGG